MMPSANHATAALALPDLTAFTLNAAQAGNAGGAVIQQR
jgi:hypothetical protein